MMMTHALGRSRSGSQIQESKATATLPMRGSLIRIPSAPPERLRGAGGGFPGPKILRHVRPLASPSSVCGGYIAGSPALRR